MTANEDRPTIAERYSRALESHHLEVKEGRGDVDLLVAAGWVHDGLGTKLYRLRSEWDAVRGEHRLAEAAAQVADKKHTVRVRAVARMAEGDDRAEALQYAREQIEAAERAALTARALIMVHLKTLHAATVALGAFAVIHAIDVRYRVRGDNAQRIAGRALDAWLDPNCPTCHGTKVTGGLFGGPKLVCAHCGGYGTRNDVRLDRSEEGHKFGRSLLVQMDEKTDYVGKQMRIFLRNQESETAPSPAELVDRLVELRSTQAERD